MNGPSAGRKKVAGRRVAPEPLTVDNHKLALTVAQREATNRAELEVRMQAVRAARTRRDCVLRSRELWEHHRVMLPLVLKRWRVHEDEIREALPHWNPEGSLVIEAPHDWLRHEGKWM